MDCVCRPAVSRRQFARSGTRKLHPHRRNDPPSHPFLPHSLHLPILPLSLISTISSPEAIAAARPKAPTPPAIARQNTPDSCAFFRRIFGPNPRQDRKSVV